jgi:TM2 domain-containing membrane protein YozV
MQLKVKFFLLLLLVAFSTTLKAGSIEIYSIDSALIYCEVREDESSKSESNAGENFEVKKESKLELKYKSAFQENRRFTAAMLTFALGMLGVHRLYLGTKPWIPAVYLFTFGGGFLILPLIDLGVILFCKDLSKYEHNDKVLMWIK